MDEQITKLTIGALLHDVGKLLYRQGDDTRKHSISGYDYLKSRAGVLEQEILDCVQFHHAQALSSADIPKDSLAYIVYIADNIAAATDRRSADGSEFGFDTQTPLQPVFNLLNGNKGSKYYLPFILNETAGINVPTDEKIPFSKGEYSKILAHLTEHLRGMEWTEAYVNSLLELLEAELSYIPSATSRQEVPDISLYDHVKMTAAVSTCIFHYLRENGISDYKQVLFEKSKQAYGTDMFMLASMDISGIQRFIYTITTKDALKTLRARSFYLEMIMEYLIDSLLHCLKLYRTNVMYAGGGHCYLMLPHTTEAVSRFQAFLNDANAWFLEMFDNDLYIAGGYSVCSSLELQNDPIGSYGQLFHRMSERISDQKMNRYKAADIIKLNHKTIEDYTRECAVCKRIGRVNENGICPSCAGIMKLSGKVLYADFFAVTKDNADGLSMLFGGYLTAGDAGYIRQLQKQDNPILHIYAKNKRYIGSQISTKLWVGNYTTGDTFEEFAKKSTGIKRIGILRADVDNLGAAFVSGFDDPSNQNRYVTISRTATLSRQLSLFFKYFINQILAQPVFHIDQNHQKDKRNASIVYSGGDDLFIVGAWDDVLEIGIDIKDKLKAYSDGTLTMSAGMGLYSSGYPISVMAEEVGRMEDMSKNYPGKNAVTLFDGKTYSWQELETEVLGEKYGVLAQFFDQSVERGKNFMYNLLDLIRNREEKINFARYVYLLSRMEPGVDAAEEMRNAYRIFAKKMVEWMQNAKDCMQLETAMILYAYRPRETEEAE